ncbi:hypothetical protein BIY24_09210 [Halobacteriovorax marinus]|uniref:Uncharacterized protein n=1 Tax=Halobacteriovorax marinus (strain ATCC BAA-682 / DSM 15412 / SJ) TaxID=862908 RepID=E1X2L1_HALMS|nr:hypothetical protein [Halobacteriovorax marinus]ATH08120.1 hypothetical protein BIY24_09210 [Halobacteriovorax marinus]CBW26778.1 hypothetical protein BMS_1963 [Halobacteriovorax marinus SJ]
MEVLKAILFTTVVIFAATEMSHAKIEKISVKRVSPITKAAGFQTFHGKILRAGDLENSAHRIVNAAEVIKKDFIEMKDGEIFYPEEIEYVFQVKGPGHTSKAPKEDERAPQDNDSN